jgi:hypothetical protein
MLAGRENEMIEAKNFLSAGKRQGEENVPDARQWLQCQHRDVLTVVIYFSILRCASRLEKKLFFFLLRLKSV